MLLTMMMLWSAAAQVDVELALSDGSTRSGRLERITDQTIAITEPDGEHEHALNSLRQIRFPNSAAAAEAPSQQLLLSDGSRLTIASFQSQGAQATLRASSGPTDWTVPRQKLQAVRLMKLEGDQQKSWQELEQSAPKSDLIVILRRDQRLHAVQGVIGDVGKVSVNFQFNGESTDVSRPRVAGLVYATPAPQQPGMALGQLVLTDASQLRLQRLALEGEQLTVRTVNGLEFRFALDQLRYVDLAATSTVYLSDMDPESTDVRPYLLVPALVEAHRRWYEPQRDRRLSRRPFVTIIDGTEHSFDKGLGLHSQTQMVYRLAGNFRRFLALAGMDETDGASHAELVILADGREVFRNAIVAGAEPTPVDVDLHGVNRMQIRVDYGNHGDLGDQISLFDARFIK